MKKILLQVYAEPVFCGGLQRVSGDVRPSRSFAIEKVLDGGFVDAHVGVIHK